MGQSLDRIRARSWDRYEGDRSSIEGIVAILNGLQNIKSQCIDDVHLVHHRSSPIIGGR